MLCENEWMIRGTTMMLVHDGEEEGASPFSNFTSEDDLIHQNKKLLQSMMLEMSLQARLQFLPHECE
jgi:hypothetical protein